MKLLKYLIAYFIARLMGTIPYYTSNGLNKLGLDSVFCGYIFIGATVFVLFTVFFMTVFVMTSD